MKGGHLKEDSAADLLVLADGREYSAELPAGLSYRVPGSIVCNV
jgi:hypothetical protein